MIDITAWTQVFLEKLQRTFANRVWFVGLQGSYGRGEATADSDIDMVVILDQLSAADIQAYETILDTLPHRELICGFLSGKAEIMHWEPSDLFQFCQDTTPIFGSLAAVMALVRESDVDRAIKIGACNIYHGCVHNMLYEKSEEILKGLYKSASFVVQAIAFRKTGTYFRHQHDLQAMVGAEEQRIIATFLYLKSGGKIDFSSMSDALFHWSAKWITQTESDL